jgi:hypothetical protein
LNGELHVSTGVNYAVEPPVSVNYSRYYSAIL